MIGCLYLLHGPRSAVGTRLPVSIARSGVGAAGTRSVRSNDQVGALWRGFRNGVAERSMPGGDFDGMAASARSTFEPVRHWLTS